MWTWNHALPHCNLSPKTFIFSSLEACITQIVYSANLSNFSQLISHLDASVHLFSSGRIYCSFTYCCKGVLTICKSDKWYWCADGVSTFRAKIWSDICIKPETIPLPVRISMAKLLFYLLLQRCTTIVNLTNYIILKVCCSIYAIPYLPLRMVVSTLASSCVIEAQMPLFST